MVSKCYDAEAKIALRFNLKLKTQTGDSSYQSLPDESVRTFADSRPTPSSLASRPASEGTALMCRMQGTLLQQTDLYRSGRVRSGCSQEERCTHAAGWDKTGGMSVLPVFYYFIANEGLCLSVHHFGHYICCASALWIHFLSKHSLPNRPIFRRLQQSSLHLFKSRSDLWRNKRVGSNWSLQDCRSVSKRYQMP